MSERARAGARTMLKGVAVVTATLLCCELALRPQIAEIDEIVAAFGPPTADGRCYGLRPGAQAIYEGWLWRVAPSAIAVDDRGYREPTRLPQPAAGVRRIALVGDSMVFGLGVNLHETLPAQLQALLRERAPVEVINAGVPGYDAPSMVLRAAEALRDFAPTEVVVLVSGNDFEQISCERWRSRNHPALRASALLRLAVMALGGDPLHDTVERAESSMEAVLDGLARLGKPVTLACLSGLEGGLRQAAAARGIRLVDLGPAHRATLADPMRYILIGEGHPNRAGVALLAADLAAGLAEQEGR